MNVVIEKAKTKCGIDVFRIVDAKKLGDESSEAMSLINKIKHQMPGIIDCFPHIPNEGVRSEVGASILKRMNLIPGVSDYVLFKPSKKYSFLCIELKVKKGNYAKANQKKFLKMINDNGGYGCVANGHEAALHVLKAYLNDEIL